MSAHKPECKCQYPADFTFCSLHAAAGELLEALEAIEPLVARAKLTSNGVYLDQACDRAQAAIAKAKGETA